jgi:hypothetical protein
MIFNLLFSPNSSIFLEDKNPLANFIANNKDIANNNLVSESKIVTVNFRIKKE